MKDFNFHQISVLKRLTISLLVLFLILFFVKCKPREGQYVSHEQWTIPDIHNPNLLKGKPFEVRELIYNNPQDTVSNSPGLVSYYQVYQFDRSGNRTLWRFVSAGQIFDFKQTFSLVGPTGVGVTYNDSLNTDTVNFPHRMDSTEVISRYTSQQISKDKFKVTHYSRNRYEDHYVVSFSNNGETVREEGWMQDVPTWTTVKHYKNGKLAMEESIGKGQKNIRQYYYSAGGFLDSVIVLENGKPSGGTYYQNNDRGDAISYIEMDGDSISRKQRMSYKYDDKGNWIKQVTFIEITHSPVAFYEPNQKFPNYSIIVREIKY